MLLPIHQSGADNHLSRYHCHCRSDTSCSTVIVHDFVLVIQVYYLVEIENLHITTIIGTFSPGLQYFPYYETKSEHRGGIYRYNNCKGPAPAFLSPPFRLRPHPHPGRAEIRSGADPRSQLPALTQTPETNITMKDYIFDMI